MTPRSIGGQVALVEDDHTLVINRGAEAGVAVGMVFAVNASMAPVITDPESGRELGRLSREKLRVRVFDVQPLFARAHTFVMTDDFYGLLHIPYGVDALDDAVTVDVGDTVQLIAQSDSHQARSTGTHR